MGENVTILSGPPSSLGIMARGLRGILPVVGKQGKLKAETRLPTRSVGLDVTVDADRVTDYCDVVGLNNTGEVPIMYLYVLSFPLIMDLFLADDFPAAAVGSVHVENTITRRRAIAIGERLSLRTSVGNLREHRKGMLLDFVTEFLDEAGESVASEVSTMLIQQRTSPSDEPAPEPPKQAKPGPPDAYLSVDGGLIRRYASVSGDRNPIHMSPLGGKAFGFPSSIAHGAWTAAAILRLVEGRIPDAATYTVRFGKPVVLPARIALYSKQTDDNGWEIVARDRKKGFPHVTGVVTPL
ncbi:MaoC/PaaZ C-terminal domain-containing protein [Tsukamurella sp. 8F]|uniref:MaoC family dehydratase n=1 Tax=unclassified Tsukamurella TaxID=2633480 RepID=UPI0023B89A16|nr:MULTISPECIES: MaoC/PaaZ C-terminal domain-containing protein [unclassified Tsukamurella]MDF0529874.1 MaoC/PaaZ C-terminal domain-containing protein [Tsukamurella sp. 8J]MDF0588671.1 MaoC/PaaZ C-terminal domain-containing protein [Tsukamurella sp. 8F]